MQVTITEPPRVRPADGRAVFFADAPAEFDPARRTPGKTIIRLTKDE